MIRFGDWRAWADYGSAGLVSPWRYGLGRCWEPARPGRLLFCGLNPSTANHLELDPTLRIVERIARRLGYGGFEVVNLFALRSTDPALVRKFVRADRWESVEHAIGLENGEVIGAALDRVRDGGGGCGSFLAGWGAAPWVGNCASTLLTMAGLRNIQPWCVGKTKSGAPRHPLYTRKDVEVIPWP